MTTSTVRLDQELIVKAEIAAKASGLTIPKQIEHWAIIGKMMEDNPDLPYNFIEQAIASNVEREVGKISSYINL